MLKAGFTPEWFIQKFHGDDPDVPQMTFMGVPMTGDKPLIGDVKTQFTFGKEEDFAAAIEAARLEQEAICGYALVVKSTRQTHYQEPAEDGKTMRDVYEVFATFAPAPPPPAPLPVDGTAA